MTCKKCNGSGGIGYYENQSPLGSGLNWPMYMEDVCPECVEKGICPKCDKAMKYSEKHDAYFCPVHGWDGCGKMEAEF
jgi:DnaJ-class molecular chaperone